VVVPVGTGLFMINGCEFNCLSIGSLIDDSIDNKVYINVYSINKLSTPARQRIANAMYYRHY